MTTHALTWIDRQARPATWATACGAPCELEQTTSVTASVTCAPCRVAAGDPDAPRITHIERERVAAAKSLAGELKPHLRATVTALPVAQLGEDMLESTRHASREARLAALANPGYVQLVAAPTDMDGVRLEISADYDTVQIGVHRFLRSQMPEIWAALGEAAWQAGDNSARMAQERNEP